MEETSGAHILMIYICKSQLDIQSVWMTMSSGGGVSQWRMRGMHRQDRQAFDFMNALYPQ
jgi:hypothetical protein